MMSELCVCVQTETCFLFCFHLLCGEWEREERGIGATATKNTQLFFLSTVFLSRAPGTHTRATQTHKTCLSLAAKRRPPPRLTRRPHWLRRRRRPMRPRPRRRRRPSRPTGQWGVQSNCRRRCRRRVCGRVFGWGGGARHARSQVLADPPTHPNTPTPHRTPSRATSSPTTPPPASSCWRPLGRRPSTRGCGCSTRRRSRPFYPRPLPRLVAPRPAPRRCRCPPWTLPSAATGWSGPPWPRLRPRPNAASASPRAGRPCSTPWTAPCRARGMGRPWWCWARCGCRLHTRWMGGSRPTRPTQRRWTVSPWCWRRRRRGCRRTCR